MKTRHGWSLVDARAFSLICLAISMRLRTILVPESFFFREVSRRRSSPRSLARRPALRLGLLALPRSALQLGILALLLPNDGLTWPKLDERTGWTTMLGNTLSQNYEILGRPINRNRPQRNRPTMSHQRVTFGST